MKIVKFLFISMGGKGCCRLPLLLYPPIAIIYPIMLIKLLVKIL